VWQWLSLRTEGRPNLRFALTLVPAFLIGAVIFCLLYFSRGPTIALSSITALLGGFVIVALVGRPQLLSGPFSQLLILVSVLVATSEIAPATVNSTEYYKAAAGIIPTLLLVLVVEKRSEFHIASRWEARASPLLVVASLTYGIYQTLLVLSDDDAAKGDAQAVAAAIAGTVAYLLCSMLTPPDRGTDTESASP
jgi:hypothetical protein